MRKTGLILLLGGTIVFIFLAVSSYLKAVNLMDAPARGTRIINRISLLERIRDPINNSIIAVRAYLLTGDETYLQPYYSALPVVNENLKRIRQEHIRRTVLQERLTKLEKTVQERFKLLDTAIDLKKKGQYNARIRSSFTARGASLDKEINGIIDTWIAEDIELHRHLGQDLSASLKSLITTAVWGTALIIGLLTLSLLLNRARSREILARQKAEQEVRLATELEKTNRFFMHILDNLPGPVIYLDKDLMIRHCNKACSEPLGLPLPEIIGKAIHEILKVNPHLFEAFENARSRGTTFRQVIPFAMPPTGKELRFYDISFRIDKDDAGTVTGMLAEGTDVTELIVIQRELDRRVEERTKELKENWNLLTDIIDNSPAAIYFKDLEGRHILINRMFADLFNMTKNDIEGKNDFDLFPHDIASNIRDHDRFVIEQGTTQEYEETVVLKRNESRTYLSVKFPLRRDGSIYGLAGISTDITDRKQAEERIAESEANLRTILEGVYDAIFIHDGTGRILDVNKKMLEMYGITYDQAVGCNIADLSAPENPLDQLSRIWERVMAGGTPLMEWKAKRPSDGTIFPVEVFLRKIRLRSRDAILASVRDITERKRMEDLIRHQAHYDHLTDLPNRLLFSDVLGFEIAQARRNAKKFALLYLDLDGFKEVNDSFGHEAGDLLLKEVAQRIKRSVRASDTVSRVGGDEFNIVMADVGRLNSIEEFVKKIIESLQLPVRIDGKELKITASIGISVYPDDSDDGDLLRRYADIAMYYAKESGKNTFQFYNTSLNVRAVEQMTFEQALRQAIASGELSVHYQPQIDIKTTRIVCVEALVRWNHPKRGMLGPDQFLPLAEDTGLLQAIDEWVLRTACAQAASWNKDGMDGLELTVNISSKEFESPALPETIAAILRETGMQPDRLNLEITERTAMSDISSSAARIQELQEIGVHISIDDFGTGYSSLNYLKKLPISRMKIDSSFIRGMTGSADDRAIVSAAASMARKLGIRSVAEGVETEDQLFFLESAECDEAQGFLFSRPVTAEAIGKMI